MAQIEKTTFRDWNNGETISSDQYEQDREILRIAVNDIDKQIKDIGITAFAPLTFDELSQDTFNQLKLGYVEERLQSLNKLTKKVTLWTGTSKGDFTTVFTLSESINNYDLVYFKLESDSGINAVDRTVVVSEWGSDELIFQTFNLTDGGATGSSLFEFNLFEYVATFSAGRDSFTNTRSTKVTVGGTDSRTDTDLTIGIKAIIGIKL